MEPVRESSTGFPQTILDHSKASSAPARTNKEICHNRLLQNSSKVGNAMGETNIVAQNVLLKSFGFNSVSHSNQSRIREKQEKPSRPVNHYHNSMKPVWDQFRAI